MPPSPSTAITHSGSDDRPRRSDRLKQPRGVIGFRGKLFASYMTATVVLLVGLTSFAQMQLAERKEAGAERRRVLVSRTLEVQNAVLRADTAQRRFALSGQLTDLADLSVALSPDLDRQLEEIVQLAASEPTQASVAARFVRNVRLKLDELGRTRELARQGQDALSDVRAAAASSILTRVFTDGSALVSAVRAKRDVGTREANLISRFAKWFIVLGNAVAFILAAAVTFWIGRAVADAHAASRELTEHGERLEEHTRKLAAQERMLELRLDQEHQLTLSLERTNQALARSNADLEQFAYVASHDLRAPLRGIASLSDWLEEELGPDISPAARKHLDTLRGRVQRLDALIRGIATYSRAGRRDESLESIDVERLVRDVVELGVPSGSAAVHVQGGIPMLTAPRAALQQIFLNLISNAVKHGVSAEGGQVEVGWSDDGDVWRFSVTDHGPGIAPEYHHRIFGLFNRLKSRDQVEGTGIGLALVKKLVERYGGRVWVQSAPGQGSTFVFTWPKDLSEMSA